MLAIYTVAVALEEYGAMIIKRIVEGAHFLLTL